VLRLTQLLRAVPHNSTAYNGNLASGTTAFYLANETDSSSSALGQSPMRSPSVFNFFRPGYSPSQTLIGDAKLVSPEMQITNETSVLSYANFVTGILRDGLAGVGRVPRGRVAVVVVVRPGTAVGGQHGVEGVVAPVQEDADQGAVFAGRLGCGLGDGAQVEPQGGGCPERCVCGGLFQEGAAAGLAHACLLIAGR
jgi:hypothetical protein